MDPTDPIPDDDPLDLPEPLDAAATDWLVIAGHLRQEMRTRVERGDLRKAKIGDFMGLVQAASIIQEIDTRALTFRSTIRETSDDDDYFQGAASD